MFDLDKALRTNAEKLARNSSRRDFLSSVAKWGFAVTAALSLGNLSVVEKAQAFCDCGYLSDGACPYCTSKGYCASPCVADTDYHGGTACWTTNCGSYIIRCCDCKNCTPNGCTCRGCSYGTCPLGDAA